MTAQAWEKIKGKSHTGKQKILNEGKSSSQIYEAEILETSIVIDELYKKVKSK